MLKLTEIKQFIDEDRCSLKKQNARKGVEYYNANHDIKDYKIYYVNGNGEMVEDENRSNIKISHPFFTELIDQCTQYMLSGKDRYIKSDDKTLQEYLDGYFDDDFKMELNDLISYTKIEGDSFLYRYVDADAKTRFKFADGLNVVEVPAKYSSDKKDYIIYYYFEKMEKNKRIEKVQVWSDSDVTYYVMIDGTIKKDTSEPLNPKPHVIYSEGDERYYDTFGDIPFLRLDNNRRRMSDLFVIKDMIDDYDLMSCGLSNNLQDVAEGIYVVKGWNGNDLDELIQNVRTKKQLSVGEGGDFDIKTINVPYQARVAKMEINEKNIYRFGMGFNTAQIGDGNVTNVVIRSRYALLDLKCNKLEMQLKRLLNKVIRIVIDEINDVNKTQYSVNDVKIDFKREVMTNALDNAQIEQITAATTQTKIGTLLSIAGQIGDDELLKRICDVLDLDYNDVKTNLKANEPIDLNKASEKLEGIEPQEV